MNDPLTSDMLRNARGTMPDVIELLGEASNLIREAANDHDAGNHAGAVTVAGDALETLQSLEAMISDMSASVAKWMGGDL